MTMQIGGTCHYQQAQEPGNRAPDQSCTCYGFEWTEHDTRHVDGALRTVCVGVGIKK